MWDNVSIRACLPKSQMCLPTHWKVKAVALGDCLVPVTLRAEQSQWGTKGQTQALLLESTAQLSGCHLDSLEC